jgi:cell division protein FtsI (penicillin-binding protein 3)
MRFRVQHTKPRRPVQAARGSELQSGSPELVRIPRWRIHTLVVLAALLLLGVIVRLWDLQVVRGAELAEMARKEINREVPLLPRRGTIFDRAGNTLAIDVELESLFVVPQEVRDPEKLALVLAPLIKRDVQELREELTDQNYKYRRIARWLDPQVSARIRELELPGLRFEYEPRRMHPQGSLAAQVVGPVNLEGEGISGVEGFYNNMVKGVAGKISAEWDGGSNPIWIGVDHELPARHGASLTLTIDPLIQKLCETTLEKTVTEHNASGGTILVMDPQTGAVLGMASWPPFDPNRYYDYPPEVYGRNPAVSDLYEPGSTFKILTAAIGLQTGAFTADTPVHDSGVINRYGEDLANWNSAGNGTLTPEGMLYYSSNVAALQFNELTGEQRFYDMIQKFGFGEPSGVELAGEQAGLVNPVGSPNYTPMSLLVNAYGQGIAVTPLQLVRAVSAIANGGKLMQPYVVQERCQDGHCVQTQPTVTRQVVDPGVAETVTQMLMHAANHYAPVVWAPRSGNWGDQWLVPGYRIAAKTGTSSIPDGLGGYEPWTIGSVVGFGPIGDARYTLLVKIDRPQDDIWGVGVAIPVFQDVMTQLMRHSRVAPDPNLYHAGQQ